MLRAVDILYRTSENLGTMLDVYLNQQNLNLQNDFLNLIKMVMYLLISTIRVVDATEKRHSEQSKSAGRKAKKSIDETSILFAQYHPRRYDVLIEICNIMLLPIEKLWTNSIVEENFVK